MKITKMQLICQFNSDALEVLLLTVTILSNAKKEEDIKSNLNHLCIVPKLLALRKEKYITPAHKLRDRQKI